MSVIKSVTGVSGFINFNKVCELFVYIMTIISLVNQTVRSCPVTANSFVLVAPWYQTGWSISGELLTNKLGERAGASVVLSTRYHKITATYRPCSGVCSRTMRLFAEGRTVRFMKFVCCSTFRPSLNMP